MSDSQQRMSPQFSLNVALPIFLTICAGIMLVYLWLRAIWPSITEYWQEHYWWIVAVGTIIILGGTCHKWVPLGWRAFKTLSDHGEQKKDRKAYRELMTVATAKLQEGYNTKYANSKTGDVLEVVNPYVAGRVQRVQEIAGTEQRVAELPPPAPIPARVRYEDVQSQVPPGHAILGVDGTGVKTCEFGKILTCLILGGSGTGKSNTVAIKVEEAIKDGWKLIVIDPHKRKTDSLYNRVKEYSYAFLHLDFPDLEEPMVDNVAQTDEQIKAVFTWFLAEFKRRLDQGVTPDDPSILIICDEVGNIADSDDEAIVKDLKKIARICGNESRGFGMAGWFMNQNATGIAWLRKVVMTVIVHKINMMSERRVACNENDALARHMDEWPKHGRVYVYGLSFEVVYELQMPFKEQRVVESMPQLPQKNEGFYSAQTEKLADGAFSPVSESGNAAEEPSDGKIVSFPGRASSEETKESAEHEKKNSGSESGVSADIRETIKRMKKKNLSDRMIAPLVGLGGRKYGIYQSVCRELGFIAEDQAEEG